MDAQYRSNLPCDNIEKAKIAKQVVKHYQQLAPAHSRGHAIQEVIGRLNDGEAEPALVLAATTYAAWCRKCGKEPQYMLSAATFYSFGGEWERFSEGVMPEVPVAGGSRDPGAVRARAIEAEMKANKERIGQMPKDAGPDRRSYKQIQEELRRQGKL